jgi:hypothetical protein
MWSVAALNCWSKVHGLSSMFFLFVVVFVSSQVAGACVSDVGECTIRIFLRNAIGVRYLDM